MWPLRGFKRILFAVLIIMTCLLLLGAATRGIQVTVKTSQGDKIELYRNSYALVVGNGNYTADWDPLPGATRDVKEVAGALEKNGFQVTLKTDLTKAGFNRAFSEFAYKYGRSKDNRLLFYYAGHGHTQQMATGEELGYLVMVDAPVPEADPINFNLSSVDMQSLVTQAKMIRARHVLFMFDSCFSGSILNLRERVVPQNIAESVQYPVRQFITAGRANEPVPDHSIFKQAFLDLLEGRDKEPIPDGYITGEELGLYLKNKVPRYNPSQHPQYGKIRDIRLDKGDFVFQLASRSGAAVDKPAAQGEDAAVLLSVESNIQRARVLVDGRVVGQTPLDDAVVSPGKHKILVEKRGYSSYQRRMAFEAGRSISLYVDLSEAKQAKGRLFVDTVPEGARVRILNIVPKFYQGMELEPGSYHVEVTADRFEKKEVWVEVKASEENRFSCSLEKILNTGRLFVESIPQGAGLYLDGKFVGETPYRLEEMDKGTHRMELKLKGYNEWAQEIEINAGEMNKILVTLKKVMKKHEAQLHFKRTAFVEDSRFWSNENYTRIIIDVNQETDFKYIFLKSDPQIRKPQRLYVDLNKCRLREGIKRNIRINDKRIDAMRIGQYTNDSVRIVLDMKSFRRYKVHSVKGPFRLIIDVID